MNGLAQITIDGQPVVLKFGMPALRRIVEKMQQYQLITGDQYNELGISHILYAGYVNHCAMKDIPPAMEYERFYSFVEDADGDVVQEIVSAIRSFEDSKHVKEAFDKKKVEKETTSEPSTGTT